jgi:Flp pilus assembly pilin Flp
MFNKKGQNTAEYAILVALVIAAAVAMQTYVKRSFQGGVKYTVDKLNDKDGQGTAGTGQYEPYYLESSYTSQQEAYKDTEETKLGGETIRSFGVDGAKKTVRYGTQTIKAPTIQPADE